MQNQQHGFNQGMAETGSRCGSCCADLNDLNLARIQAESGLKSRWACKFVHVIQNQQISLHTLVQFVGDVLFYGFVIWGLAKWTPSLAEVKKKH